MSGIFESPWLLLSAAAISVVIAAMLWQAGARGGRWWFVLPVALAALAFALDAAVATDNEKIHALIRQARRAVLSENAAMLAELVSPDYQDRIHPQKSAFLNAVQNALTGAGVEKIRFQQILLTFQPPACRVQLDVVVHLKENSRYAALGSLVFASGQLRLQKNHAGQWLIHKAGVSSINNQPLQWGDID